MTKAWTGFRPRPAAEAGCHVSRRTLLQVSCAMGGTAALVGATAGATRAGGAGHRPRHSPSTCGRRAPSAAARAARSGWRWWTAPSCACSWTAQRLRRHGRPAGPGLRPRPTSRHRIYNPDRLKKPMKPRRPAPRGGQWEDHLVGSGAGQDAPTKMRRSRPKYGSEAFYINYTAPALCGAKMACSLATGSNPVRPAAQPHQRLSRPLRRLLDHEISAYYFYATWVQPYRCDAKSLETQGDVRQQPAGDAHDKSGRRAQIKKSTG